MRVGAIGKHGRLRYGLITIANYASYPALSLSATETSMFHSLPVHYASLYLAVPLAKTLQARLKVRRAWYPALEAIRRLLTLIGEKLPKTI
jgi:hypothetical protein